MPQLDPNTFIYQYAGVISLLAVVYIALSYIILPIILRLMLVRNSFLTTKQSLSDLVSNVAPEQQFIISLKTPINSTSLANQFFVGLNSLSSSSIKLLSSKMGSYSLSGPQGVSPIVSTSSFNLDYLILFLTTDINEEINE